MSQTEPAPDPDPKPDFCQLTEDRRFSHEEFDWREANARGNLNYQITQNELRKELGCPKTE